MEAGGGGVSAGGGRPEAYLGLLLLSPCGTRSSEKVRKAHNLQLKTSSATIYIPGRSICHCNRLYIDFNNDIVVH